MKTLLLILFLIPNLVMARVCYSFINSDTVFVGGPDSNCQKGDIYSIRAEGSNSEIKKEAVSEKNLYCDFSKTISIIEWDKPPTLNISCVFKGR